MTSAVLKPNFPSILTVVDPDRRDDDLTLDELGSRIVGMSGRLAAATCRWLLLVALFDEREGYVRFGLHSTAYWLSHQCGIARRTAVEHVRAISRVPRAGEHEVVADLITAAQHGTASQLESLVQGMRFSDKAARDAHGYPVPDPEYVRGRWSAAGKRRLAVSLEAEHGAVVDSALARVAQAEGVTAAEALVCMAEWALAIVTDERVRPRELRGEEYAAVVVHVDAASYPAQARSAERGNDSAPAMPAGRIADGPGLSQAVVERLACTGRVRLIVHDKDTNPLDVGRSSRTVTKKQFRALLDRDKHCTQPGCTSTKGLEGHHVVHWLRGGRTDMDNLVLLCEAHHHAHHDGEFYLVPAGKQKWRFVRADGRELLHVVHPDQYADGDQIERDYDTAHDAPATRWDGQHLDRPYAVSVLADRRARSAERDEHRAS